MRHSHQTSARKGIKRPLPERAQSGHGPPAAGDDYLASPLHSLQVLAEAVMKLTNSDFALRLM
ncbi:MAG TPA: hypothetical protein VFY04_03895 [Solirubrobacterales bacterium]|nr:hypothetical protein [Solirubrobacterales bacterium]